MKLIVGSIECLQQELRRRCQSAGQEEDGMGVTYAQQTVYTV